MISLSDPGAPLDRALLGAPGGFVWWYLDLVDDRGDGAVLIWSFGLPFLPGYGVAARAGRPELPGRRPSLNVATYEGGRCTFYLLQEYAPEEVEWVAGTERCRLGASLLETRLEGGRRRVDAHLDCALPGTSTRLLGTMSTSGPPMRHHATASSDHQWTPLLAAAPGAADLHVDDTLLLALAGRAYHDRNGSRRPLHDLGIGEWIWGRAAVGDTERIWYLLWPEDGADPLAIGLEVAPDGAVVGPFPLGVERHEPRRGRYGLRWWARLQLTREGAPWTEVHHGRPVDDGPFYLRLPVQTSGGRGWGEVVRPDRVDRPWMRPFVRMRVDGPDRSPFAPLFNGLASGRLRRLLGAGR